MDYRGKQSRVKVQYIQSSGGDNDGGYRQRVLNVIQVYKALTDTGQKG